MTQDVETVYPEHAKMGKVKEKSQTIGEFLDWLKEQSCGICTIGQVGPEVIDRLAGRSPKNREWCQGGEFQSLLSIEKWLTLYFKIDPDKLEAEKQQMLDDIRTGKWNK